MISQLRVASGQLKGLMLDTPAQSTTHPMGAREKLALFNMIRPQLPGAKVLDLYAGTGALGIEALSNGATEVVFVEQHPKVANILAQNLHAASQRLGSTSRFELIRSSVENFLQVTERRFDLILADPPYDDFKPYALHDIACFLQREGYFVLSFPQSEPTPEFAKLTLVTERRYAAAGIAIYRQIA